MSKTKRLVLISFFIALQIVLMFLSFPTPFMTMDRLNLAFIPLMLCSAIFGPIWGGISAVFADILNFYISGTGGGGMPNPGITLSALLKGVIYGLILYKKPLSWKRTILAVAAVGILIDIGLNSIWFITLFNINPQVILTAKIAQRPIFMVFQTILYYYTAKGVFKSIEKRL